MRSVTAFVLGLIGWISGTPVESKPSYIYRAALIRAANEGVREAFFGLHPNGTLYDTVTIWPYWNPTSVRVASMGKDGIDVVNWSHNQPSPLPNYDWSRTDMAIAKFKEKGVRRIIATLIYPPNWTVIGNGFEKPVDNISIGNPAIVRVNGNEFRGGMRIFFHGGTVPQGITLGTKYCIARSCVPGTSVCNAVGGAVGDTFTISNCAGSEISTTGGTTSGSLAEISNSLPASQSYVTTYIRALIGHVKSRGMIIEWFEAINEPNSDNFFTFRTYEELATYQRWVWEAVKGVDPSIKVLLAPVNSIGRLSPTCKGSICLLNQVFLAAPEIGNYFDIAAVHAYPVSDANNPSNPGYESINQTTLDLDGLKAFFARNGQGHKPLVISEYNTETNDPEINRRYAAKWNIIAASRGVVGNYHYLWDASASDPYDYNLWVRPNGGNPGTLTPLGIAYREVRSWLLGAKILTKPDGVSPVQTAELRLGNGHKGLIVYSANINQAHTEQYTAPAWAVRYRDLVGNVTLIKSIGEKITIGVDPIMFESH